MSADQRHGSGAHYTPEAAIVNYLLVHVGFAITVVDEVEAERVFRYLEEIADLEEELGTAERTP